MDYGSTIKRDSKSLLIASRRGSIQQQLPTCHAKSCGNCFHCGQRCQVLYVARQYALIHRAIPKKDEPQQIGQGFLFPNCHCNFVLGDFVDLLIFMKFHLRRVWCIYETYVSTLEQRAHQGAVFKNLGRFEKKHHVTPQENGEILKSPCFLNVSSF